MLNPRTMRALNALPVLAILALFAGPAGAQERMIDAARVFPLLDKFYATPPSERSMLAVRYVVTHEGKPALDAGLTLVVNGRRTPIGLAADGAAERLPTAAELAAHAQVAANAPPTYKIGSRLDLITSIRPAQEIAADPCALAVTQANTVIRRAAGVMAMVAPKVKAVVFVGAGSGVAVLSDGKTAPLPLIKGAPAYDPEVLKGAKLIRLAKTPSVVSLE